MLYKKLYYKHRVYVYEGNEHSRINIEFFFWYALLLRTISLQTCYPHSTFSDIYFVFVLDIYIYVYSNSLDC